MSLFYRALNVLDSCFLNVSYHPIGDTKSEIVEMFKEFYTYSAFAGPLLAKIGISKSFYHDRNLSLLFMPFFVNNEVINVTAVNFQDLVTFLEDPDFFDSEMLRKVWKVNCYRWGSNIGELDLSQVELFLSLLPGLRVLSLKSHTTDEIFGYLARYCPNLQVVDCREDYYFEVTDNGLEELAQLKKLRYVLFDAQADESRRAVYQMRFTGSGIAKLMKALPELIKLECPEYLMRVALHKLEYSKVILPTIKSINLEGCGSRPTVFLAANKVCPNVTELSATVHLRKEAFTGLALGTFDHLNSLTLNIPCAKIEILDVNHLGQKLTTLDIRKGMFLEEDFFAVNESCPNLKLLALCDDQHDNKSFDPQNWVYPIRPLVFASLDTLVYNLPDIRGLLLFMQEQCPITSLFIKVGFHVRKRAIVDVLENLYGGLGYWPFLRVLSIPDLQCDKSLVMQLIEGLPCLESINVRISDSQEQENIFCVQGRHVKLSSFYDDDPFPPKHLADVFDLS